MITGKPWLPYTRDEIEDLPNDTGIYELADAHMETLYIGSTGLQGLKDQLLHLRVDRPDEGIASAAVYFRYEVVEQNDAWQMRLIEAFQAAHQGRMPVCNHHVMYENLGGMLHRVTTDKSLKSVLDDLKRDLVAGGLVVEEQVSDGSGFAGMLLVADPQKPEIGKGIQLSALPGVITGQEVAHQSVLQMLRPTTLIDMFGQDDLKEVAARIEGIAIQCMDEAAA